MYSGTRLVDLLKQQHQTRHPGLFKSGTFTVKWRAKVGSFPHPDVETIVSAGEPCGSWKTGQDKEWRPEDKRNVAENCQQLYQLPLNGYIPGSCIRGIVREWAKKRPEIKPRMLELLGYQTDDKIYSGKIEFLDAWPKEPEPLTLDIVNPQETFQVFHQDQSTPLSLYTLGDGEDPIPVTVAIRGIPSKKATPEEVDEVWGWVQQALTLYGVGSRTASGYGAIKSRDPNAPKAEPDPNCKTKVLTFKLYSQGCYGVDSQDPVLRPSHWRGWMRSWMLRFLLGVMSPENAKKTLGELFGVLEPEGQKGCVRIELVKGRTWGEKSTKVPYFYTWKGQLKVTAPQEVLNTIIWPVLKFAAMVGGVGRGWRRPLHIFRTDRGYEAARGSHVVLTHKVRGETKGFGMALKPEQWVSVYQKWSEAVQQKWAERFRPNQNPEAEVFSPWSCAVYLVPEPVEDPLNQAEMDWEFTTPQETRGEGVNLIYQPTYKRKSDVGGDAAGGGNSHCSWVSIKRVTIRNPQADTDCKEVVCLFMGGQTPNTGHLRSRFLQDLARIQGAVRLFGVRPH
ncbi:RAMP superfamily CRISPR-associated protein [Spirulina subsalsa]|uniref:RAMP superfamily CRISPR-associated protein n=1 Tax=Spirulina subsalsa TaxID=54311 RepID=UPI0002D5A047|nr:RAMP superfamily CRISPR-associated protein [Spirulina subsalsa]